MAVKTLAALLPAVLIFSCASKRPVLEEAPIISSATYQHTQYNGRNQAVEVYAAKDDVPPFIITYFRSEEDLERDQKGSKKAPSEVGDYYVKIERPGGNGYQRGKNIKIEYHIQKAFLSIITDPVRRFVYDGTPKEITALTEPPVESPLLISYFIAGSDTALPVPPSEKGRYLVRVVFSGNERYMGASREIDLWIE